MRTVRCQDALPYLDKIRLSRLFDGGGEYSRPDELPGSFSIVTSLPDASEMGLEPPKWRSWFRNAAYLCLDATPHDCPCVFFQTDRKYDGEWISKAEILLGAARDVGARLLWHKIVLRRKPGATDLHRPGYSHLMAFSAEARPGPATPDVLPVSPSLYANGMPLAAADAAVSYVSRYSRVVLDPFCGRGTVLAMAARYGMDQVGVDVDPAQVAASETCSLTGSIGFDPTPELVLGVEGLPL
jgi:hypothetical protein